jgi:hypothetical protein
VSANKVFVLRSTPFDLSEIHKPGFHVLRYLLLKLMTVTRKEKNEVGDKDWDDRQRSRSPGPYLGGKTQRQKKCVRELGQGTCLEGMVHNMRIGNGLVARMVPCFAFYFF